MLAQLRLRRKQFPHTLKRKSGRNCPKEGAFPSGHDLREGFVPSDVPSNSSDTPPGSLRNDRGGEPGRRTAANRPRLLSFANPSSGTLAVGGRSSASHPALRDAGVRELNPVVQRRHCCPQGGNSRPERQPDQLLGPLSLDRPAPYSLMSPPGSPSPRRLRRAALSLGGAGARATEMRSH